jgi:hypothetical protein
MNCQHTDVGAYSLGLLERQDRQAFEAHLAQCESCTAELGELSAMASLLSNVEPFEAGQDEVDETTIADLVRQRSLAQRHRDRRRALVAAAAGLVLLAGGAAVGLAAAPNQVLPVTSQVVSGQRHFARNARTGVTGTIGLVPKPWGTEVTLDLAGVRGPLLCQLVAVSVTGQRQVVIGWFVPRAGYGVPSHPAHLVLLGGTAIGEKELAVVDVDVVHGATLLSIPTGP